MSFPGEPAPWPGNGGCGPALEPGRALGHGQGDWCEEQSPGLRDGPGDAGSSSSNASSSPAEKLPKSFPWLSP